MLIADTIRRARVRRGLSQRRLAALLGVSSVAICHWECGRSSPRDTIKRRVAFVLRIDVLDLIPQIEAA